MSIPSTVCVRLDAQTRETMGQYLEKNGLTLSQGLRVLLALALREEGQSPDEVFRAAAFQEGIRAGATIFSKRIQEAISLARSELEAS